MNGYCKLILCGTVIRPVEVKSKYSKFTVGTSKSYKDKSGNWDNKKRYYNLIAFGKIAEYVNKHIKKLDTVLLECDLEIGTYEKDGVSRPQVSIIVQTVEILNKGNASQEETESTSSDSFEEDEVIKNLPF